MAKSKKAKAKQVNGLTRVAFLLDRTGSMGSVKDDTIGAFNAYLDGLDDGANILFSLVQFDSVSIDKVCVAVPPAQAPRLTNDNYQPRAWTPLIDACVKTIKAVEESVATEPDTKVVICFQTDGQENSSTEYTWEELNALIKAKMALGWQFIFMGAGLDAYEQGERMGVSVGSTVSYNKNDAAATRATYAFAASNTSSFAKGDVGPTGEVSVAFSSAQKAASGDQFVPPTASVSGQSPWQKPTPPIVTPPPAKKPAKIVEDFKL